jgi:hypothetical protein
MKALIYSLIFALLLISSAMATEAPAGKNYERGSLTKER